MKKMEQLAWKINGLIKRRPRRCDDCDAISGIVYVVRIIRFARTLCHSVKIDGQRARACLACLSALIFRISYQVAQEVGGRKSPS